MFCMNTLKNFEKSTLDKKTTERLHLMKHKPCIKRSATIHQRNSFVLTQNDKSTQGK